MKHFDKPIENLQEMGPVGYRERCDALTKKVFQMLSDDMEVISSHMQDTCAFTGNNDLFLYDSESFIGLHRLATADWPDDDSFRVRLEDVKLPVSLLVTCAENDRWFSNDFFTDSARLTCVPKGIGKDRKAYGLCLPCVAWLYIFQRLPAEDKEFVMLAKAKADLDKRLQEYAMLQRRLSFEITIPPLGQIDIWSR